MQWENPRKFYGSRLSIRIINSIKFVAEPFISFVQIQTLMDNANLFLRAVWVSSAFIWFHVQAQDPVPSAVPLSGATTAWHSGAELSAGAQVLHSFGRFSPAAHAEIVFRGAGSQAHRKGNFSIGASVLFHPSMGQWNEVPFRIGHVNELNVSQLGVEDVTMRVNGTTLNEGSLFLSPFTAPEIIVTGFFSLSFSGLDAVKLDLYEIRDVRMDMLGLMVPLRWHFGNDNGTGPRFFAETGLGLDLLRTSATYDLERTSATLRQEGQLVFFTVLTQEFSDVAPLEGNLAQHVLFTRLMVGGGVDIGRIRFFVRGQHTVSKELEQGGRSYRRVRGDLFALPVLAEAWNDAEVSSTLAAGGVVPFGRTDIANDKASASTAESSDRSNGVDRFWNSIQAIIGASFVIR